MIIDPTLTGGPGSVPYPIIALPPGTILTSLKEDLKGMLSVEMSIVHNLLIRGVNSVYTNAPNIAPQDIPAFAGYCLVVVGAIQDHHEYEDMFIVPVLEKRIPEIAGNAQQHQVIQDGMEVFKQYMIDVKEGKETYDWEKARKLCKGFADSMVRHLHDEIPIMSPQKLSAFDDEPKLLEDMLKSINEHARKKPGKLTAFPFVIMHHDSSKAPNWPDIPGPMMWFAKYIAPSFNSSYWKFSPFKRNGTPQQYTPSDN